MIKKNTIANGGQTLVEYALIIALVSVALIAALNALKGGISGSFSKVSAQL
jgi:Flp pilus assembly pilin Flp